MSTSAAAGTAATAPAPTATAETTTTTTRTPPTIRSNVPASVSALLNRKLLHVRDHPLAILKTAVEEAFPGFARHDDLPAVVSTKACFDDLLIPPGHAIRSPSDTFYVDAERILRPHTSAHQTELLRKGETAFLVAGDVYRRDEIDATHFPAFHQMEGVKVFPRGTTKEEAFADLKTSLERMCDHIFKGQASRRKWVDAYFPFTEPSAELEVTF